MTCAEINGLLDRLMDGELSEEERRELAAHGETCPACADEIRATLQMKALFEEMEPEVDVPLAAQARWRRAVREDAAQRRRKRLTRWIGSVAAALVVLVGVGLALNGSLAPKRDSASIMPAGDSAAEVEVVQEAEDEDQATTLGEEPSEATVVETDGAGEAPKAVAAGSADEAPPMAAGSANEAPIESDSGGEAFESAEADSAMEAQSAPMVEDRASESNAVPDLASEPEEDAMQAESSDADDDKAAEDDAEAMVEDAEESEAAVAAPLSPACELDLQVTGVDSICMIVSELAADFDATADVQPVEDGSANIYVMIDAEAAPAFMEAVLMMDESEAKPAVPEVAETGTVQILLVLTSAGD